ncbi:DNA alkylation repair protein [Flammeovirga pacifica]|uniref:DNA alkylation repair protein n=1 Tax=Flammeovirga pacifica TaxID=915059 RepID=A0A1S1YTF8_FLAPC|nr:DNA alkylation repair protein [Flammeovirga pacifica]OHX64298.1 hypothetical protein NH26_22120 [Flammeovirga pacifica]
MAEPLKNIYSTAFVDLVADSLEEITTSFDRTSFITEVFDTHWEKKELKERTSHMAVIVRGRLDENFKKCVDQLIMMIEYYQKVGYQELMYASLGFIFIPEIIEKYGLDDFPTSIQAFPKITPFTSCEFAVRPFIIKNQQKMLEVAFEWSKHENEHVRRLSSEGTRPRLPWGVAFPALKKDPLPLMAILENLKNDSSEYVRRSVANNLNDISKDHPQFMIDIANKWMGETIETDALIKHACRTLLKEGRCEVLQLFGYASPKTFEIKDFTILSPKVKFGGALDFQFEIINTSSKLEKVRIEYGLYFLKKNGTHSKKVFKISEGEYKGKKTRIIQRQQSFRRITTRTYYAGIHQVSLIINGQESEKLSFELCD